MDHALRKRCNCGVSECVCVHSMPSVCTLLNHCISIEGLSQLFGTNEPTAKLENPLRSSGRQKSWLSFRTQSDARNNRLSRGGRCAVPGARCPKTFSDSFLWGWSRNTLTRRIRSTNALIAVGSSRQHSVPRRFLECSESLHKTLKEPGNPND